MYSDYTNYLMDELKHTIVEIGHEFQHVKVDEAWLQLAQKGHISTQSLLQKMDIDFKEECLKLQVELLDLTSKALAAPKNTNPFRFIDLD